MTTFDHREGLYLEELQVRLRRLAWIAAAFFAAVIAGYWSLQILEASEYRALSENNRLRKGPISAPRGLITDVEGRRLVENVPSYRLHFDRSAADDRDASLVFAANVLGVETEELQRRLAEVGSVPDFKPVLLAEDLSLNQVSRFEVASLEHPEFSIEVLHRRLYRHGAHTAHVLGYLGEVTEEDLRDRERGLRSGHLVGKKGLEYNFDDELRGSDGERVLVVDSRGRRIDEFVEAPATAGENLELTLDLELQQEAEEALGDRVGAVVALDPRDGAVRVLLSSPSYDPNKFARRLQKDEWDALVSSPFHPLQNRAIQNSYPPGSVFKIVLAIAQLSEGLDAYDKVWCGGSVRLHDRRRRCHLSRGHGWVDLHDAIKHSCDIYFYQKGQELGIDKIAEYARKLGLGQRTGIDLDGERAGLVPDAAWSQRVRNTRWYPGETVSVAIGQGPLLVTPLQAAVMLAAVVNGGRLVTPYLVDEHAQAAKDLQLGADELAEVRRALEAVVNDLGSGASARLEAVRIGGKTGTAQVIEQKTWTSSDSLPYEHRDHAWFASYAPADAPELVVVVFVEHGGQGSRSAAPIARKLYERYFGSRRPDAS
ncbi:MAG: penicillin-binding protein 2 [Acidobacteriota bacterium]